MLQFLGVQAPTRILIFDDDAIDAELIRRALCRHNPAFHVRHVFTEQDYLVALGSHAPDVILSDYKLPLYGAAFALKMALEFFPDVPFMLVSDVLQDDLAGELLKRGARAYLSKSDLSQIGPAIDQALANTGRRNDDKCSMPDPGLS